MGFYLVPADFAWLSDVNLRDALLSNIKAKVEEKVRDLTQERGFTKTPQTARVTDIGNALLVEVGDVSEEKGVKPHVMTYLEGQTIPIRTAAGGVSFRKASRLSIMLGKFRNPGHERTDQVKRAIEGALSESAEAVIETKDQLEEGTPSPRLRDVLGIR
jgi:hypothetical protein